MLLGGETLLGGIFLRKKEDTHSRKCPHHPYRSYPERAGEKE